jgi:Protein of unknown function (DUF1203)
MANVSTSTYRLEPISATNAEALRAKGGTSYIADSKPGYPCRQCLRDAEIGEELLLVSYDPFTIDSPYRSASPIFLHVTSCAPDESSALPEQLTRRQLSIRAFDCDAMMIDAAVIDGANLDSTLQQMFADDHTEVVHVHNAGRGCWATNVTRAP